MNTFFHFFLTIGSMHPRQKIAKMAWFNKAKQLQYDLKIQCSSAALLKQAILAFFSQGCANLHLQAANCFIL